ncbi:hypothetical protein quinque_005696 [Culex quinquefasciatus]
MKFYLAVVPFLLLLVPTRQQRSWISSNKCGIRKVKTSDGQWPWHVAVYRATPTNRTMEYTCGGTLISEKFVLTAGQCVLDEYLNLLNSNLFALVPPSAPDYANRLPKQCGNFIPSRLKESIHSEVYEFPWMALVGYHRLHYTYLPYFSCTGTLINRRYVLTSGACVSHGKINVVRLGEQEIGNHRDCDLIDKNDCALYVLDYNVEYLIKHHSHDIGLIRLAGNVVYEDHIQPVCLPMTNELQNQRPALHFVTGHGGEPLGAAVLYNGYRFVQFGIRTQVNRCDLGAAIYLNVAYFLDWIMFSMEAKDFAKPEYYYQ